MALTAQRSRIHLRRSLFILGLISAGALSGCLAGWLIEQRTSARGTVYGVPPKIALAYHDLGATVDLTELDANGRERVSGGAPCLKVRWLRQPIRWREIEKSPGQFDWPRLDLPLVDAYGRRLQVLAVLQDSPAWAREGDQPPSAPPKDWRTLGAFARALSEHFKDQIDAYQIWDEPNIAAGWGGNFPSASQYMRLLREAALNIRAVDANARIVSAALAPTTENGPLNLNEPEFLRGLYRAGAQDFFDAVGAEPFGFWTGPDDRRLDPGVLNFSRVILLREVMEANGDGGKAIWATSFGWSIAGIGDPGFGADEQPLQLERTIRAVSRAQDEWAWMGPMMFTRWAPIGSNDPRAGFALQDAEGKARLLSGVGTGCANMRVAPVGHYDADDWSAVYPSTWRVTSQGADAPQNDRAPLTIGFRGTRFDLRLRGGNYEGYLFVKLDGQPANGLPHDEQGRSYVVLYDPLAQTTDVMLAGDLADQEHFIEITPQGGWGQWAIAGWTVSRERADAGRWQLLGALTGGMLGGISAWFIGRRTKREGASAVRRALASFPAPALIYHRSLGDRLVYALTAGIAAMLYLSQNTLLSWLLILLLALLVLWRLHAGLTLVALAIPFYLQPKSLGVGSYSTVEIALLLCVLSFSARYLLAQPGIRVQPQELRRQLLTGAQRLAPLDYAIALWVVAGGLGVIVAENFGVANRELRVVFVEPALFYVLVRSTRMDGRTLANAFLIGAIIVSGKALTDWLSQRDLIAAEGVLRARSVYFSPNNLALFLDRAAPLALCLALFGRSRRVLYFLAFGLIIVALYLTFAKGAWLLALPSAVVLIGVMRAWQSLMRSKPGSRTRMVAGVAAVLIFLPLSLLPVLGTERMRSLFDLTSGTTFYRVQLWQSTLAMIRDHALFGVGLDNFLYQYRTRYILPAAFAEANLSHPHNVLLDFWTRLGLLGVILLCVLQAVFWRHALWLYRKLQEGDERALVLGLMASMAAALAHGLIDNSFFLVDLAFVLMMTLGIVGNMAVAVRGRDADASTNVGT